MKNVMRFLLPSLCAWMLFATESFSQSTPCSSHPTEPGAQLVAGFTVTVPLSGNGGFTGSGVPEGTLNTFDNSGCQSHNEVCIWLMPDGGSIVTLTYYGSVAVMPHYNVMGVAKAALESSVRYLAHDLGPKRIRVNAISAGPIKTLSASGVAGFRKMLSYHDECAPLRQTVTQEDVGNAALYLCSDLGARVTGQVIYVDAGWSILGMTVPLEELDRDEDE